MPSLKMREGNVTHLRVQGRVQSLDDGGLPHSGLSGEKADAAILGRPDGCPQLIDTLPRQSRCLYHTIAGALVDPMEISKLLRKFFSEYVNLVQDDGGRDAIHLAGHQQPVQERQLDLREEKRHDDERAVQVGGDHVRLPRKVGRAADHIVPAVQHLDDRGGTCGGRIF